MSYTDWSDRGMSGKHLLSTKKYTVLSNRPGYDMSALQPCNHPEENKILLHLTLARANGHKKSCSGSCFKDKVCCTSICVCEGACMSNDGGDDE